MKRKVVCLLAAGFEDSEFKMPTDQLRKAGFEVEVVGAKAGETLQGKAHRESIKVDVGIDDASGANYMGMLIPGGSSPAELRKDPRFVKFVQEFNTSKKPIAAICHGPQLLISAGVVKGRKMTGYKTVQEELKKHGATVSDDALVADGNFITSRTPEDLPQFCNAVVTQFDVNADQSWMARGDVHTQQQ
jgi:protease I